MMTKVLLVACAVVALLADPATASESQAEQFKVKGLPKANVPSASLRHLFENVYEKLPIVKQVIKPTSGAVPAWFNGKLFHNGFGQFTGKDAKSGAPWKWNYLFDALPYVSQFDFDGAAMTFTSRMLNVSEWRAAQHGPPAYRSFGGSTPAAPTLKILRSPNPTACPSTF
jgi:hypothetical protein